MDAKLFVPAILIALTATSAHAQDKQLPEGCDKAARATIAGAVSADGNDDTDDVIKSVVFSHVKVTKRGEIPPADGVTDIDFTARFKSDSLGGGGTVKATVTRGGCIIEEMNFGN